MFTPFRTRSTVSTAQPVTVETVRADELAGRASGNAWPAHGYQDTATNGFRVVQIALSSWLPAFSLLTYADAPKLMVA